MTRSDKRKKFLMLFQHRHFFSRRSLCTTIQLIASERCAVSLPIFKSDDTRDMLIRKACLASDDSKVTGSLDIETSYSSISYVGGSHSALRACFLAAPE